MYENPTTYRRGVVIRLTTWATAAAVLLAAGCTVTATGHLLSGVLFGVSAVCATIPTVNWLDVYVGERHRPRADHLTPLDDTRRDIVNRAVATIDALDDNQRERLARSYRNNRETRGAHLRAQLTADWAGRLYDGDTNFGAEALAAVANVPYGADVILGLLVADLVDVDDVTALLDPWAAAGLAPFSAFPTNRPTAWGVTQ